MENNHTLTNVTTYTWSQLESAPNSGSTVCLDSKGNLYAARNYYVPQGTSGDLAVWNSTTKSWTSVGGSFNNTINAVCADSKGNIYVVGAFTDPTGCCYVAKYNTTTKLWNSMINPNIKYPINHVCCDSIGNVYITGNFINLNNNFYVATFTQSRQAWRELSGGNFGNNIIIDMCYGSGNLYALVNTPQPNGSFLSYINIWDRNSNTWKQLTSQYIGSGAQSICYNDGVIYVSYTDGSNTSVASYDISSAVWNTTPSIGVAPNVTLIVFCDNSGNLYVLGYDPSYSNFLYTYNYSSQSWSQQTSISFPSSLAVFMSICGNSENVYIGGTFNFVLQGILN
jgi:hypothetical protein